MEINELLKIGVDRIKGRQYGNPVLEATLLLGKLLNVDKVYIYTHGREQVPEEIVEKYMEAIEKRSKGYPIQYIIKEREFMDLNFYIEEGVLIPRPDTEIIVEYILEYIDRKHLQEQLYVLDIGIGSGAIGLSIAYHRKNTYVYGVDISPQALKVASINRNRFGLENVKIIESDLFENISNDIRFHIIVSNPPYIPTEDINSLQEEVKNYEPRLALDGGKEGMDYYRKIIPESKKFLREDGLLIFEIGYDQGPQVKGIMIEEGFKDIEILKDLQGLDRAVLGIR
ncbi:MAG: peptide chain release factor N(5)-glutamine methyltransferase [Tissierellia bacterium]|nr:peptide chain release factor N(5)-glutamine methyltransferase [Tissierellia bacterium]